MTTDIWAAARAVSQPRRRFDHALWAVVVVASLADVGLTLVGLSLCFSEANPVARFVLDAAGGAGLVGLKLGALGVLFAVYRQFGPMYRRVALAAFSLPQLFAVGHNSLLLIRHAPAC